MQKSLYDPSGARTIWKDHHTNTEGEDVEEFSDLLVSNEDDSEQADIDWIQEKLLDSDDDDLLEDEDDDDLLPSFGDDDDDDDVITNGDLREMLCNDLLHSAVSGDDLLLSGGSEDESMLL